MQHTSPGEIAEVAQWFVQALDYPARTSASEKRGAEQAIALPPSLARWLPDAQQLLVQRDGVTYCGLFDIGKPEPPVPLLESHYHRDPTARLRRVVNFYRAYGVVQDAHHAPDHLCVELSYLAYLARIAAMYPLRADLVDATRAFARAHPASFAGKCLDALRQHVSKQNARNQSSGNERIGIDGADIENDSSATYIALFTGLVSFLADVGGETRIRIAGEEAA